MDYTYTTALHSHTVVNGVKNLCLDEILSCGQCFRWNMESPGRWSGVAMGQKLTLYTEGDQLVFLDTTLEEFEGTWRDYFDLGRDYGALKSLLRQDPVMRDAVDFCPGMRVLRQDPWEALCSFIISQNNNIPRIRGIVERLCEAFGNALPDGGFSFPSPARLAGLSVEELAPVRSGFRAKYLLDAARRVAGGQLTLDQLDTLPLEEARQSLKTVKGVGPKVAECALLYGCGRAECMPVDVWIARALEELYPQGFPAAFTEVAGLAQQYLFHYMRKGRESAVATAT